MVLDLAEEKCPITVVLLAGQWPHAPDVWGGWVGGWEGDRRQICYGICRWCLGYQEDWLPWQYWPLAVAQLQTCLPPMNINNKGWSSNQPNYYAIFCWVFWATTSGVQDLLLALHPGIIHGGSHIILDAGDWIWIDCKAKWSQNKHLSCCTISQAPNSPIYILSKEFKESREHGVGAEAAHCKQMGNLDSATVAPICPHREFPNPPSRELENFRWEEAGERIKTNLVGWAEDCFIPGN